MAQLTVQHLQSQLQELDKQYTTVRGNKARLEDELKAADADVTRLQGMMQAVQQQIGILQAQEKQEAEAAAQAEAQKADAPKQSEGSKAKADK